MRLRAEIWVKAYIRGCANQGVAVMVVHHGDDDAGAIYIKICRLDGTARLFGPAPPGLDDLEPQLKWAPLLIDKTPAESEIDLYLAQQRSFDPDLWVIEVEDRQGRHFLDDWLASPRT